MDLPFNINLSLVVFNRFHRFFWLICLIRLHNFGFIRQLIIQFGHQDGCTMLIFLTHYFLLIFFNSSLNEALLESIILETFRLSFTGSGFHTVSLAFFMRSLDTFLLVSESFKTTWGPAKWSYSNSSAFCFSCYICSWFLNIFVTFKLLLTSFSMCSVLN